MLFTTFKQRTQLKIYAMFMLADGECSAEEQEKLNTIYKEMDIREDIQEEVKECCKGLSIKQGDNSKLIIQEIDNLLGGSLLGLSFFGGLNRDINAQVETVWTLINLGYADTDFSEPERKVVDHLVKKWELKDVLVDELMDTADTILMLTKQKEWIRETAVSYSEREKRIQEVDQKIQRMFDNIKVTISEADAV